ncbi:cadmium resistance transporter [Micromonospora purpureochromogenes]
MEHLTGNQTDRPRGQDERPQSTVANGLVSMAAVTIANGADNVSVYTPVFRTIGLTNTLITLAVFAIGVALWCFAGSWLGSAPEGEGRDMARSCTRSRAATKPGAIHFRGR